MGLAYPASPGLSAQWEAPSPASLSQPTRDCLISLWKMRAHPLPGREREFLDAECWRGGADFVERLNNCINIACSPRKHSYTGMGVEQLREGVVEPFFLLFLHMLCSA
ncbi:hypothetical protein AMECASPLE_000779 [Ameca splendens]|uniref:Uncharacterized protein n=1 Tax=Ameca splendens TaxID=208324 RepID=A0ABV0XLU6_9TELE